jgi:nucleoside-diphosphate-sugar epimerase
MRVLVTGGAGFLGINLVRHLLARGDDVTEDSFVSIEHAKTQLRWRPNYSNKDALVRNYRWYVANADRLGDAGVTHRVPWKQGALALAKLVFRPHPETP